VTLSIVTLAIVLPKTLKPQRYERLPEKWAGIWIKNQSGQGTTIFTGSPRVAFYADGNSATIDLKRETIDQIRASMVEKGTLYLVIEEREAANFPEKKEAIKKNFSEVMRYEKKGMEKIIIYKRAQ